MISSLAKRFLTVTVFLLVLVSCTRTVEGFIPSKKDVKALIIGVSTKYEVIERYGLSPLVSPKGSNSLLYMRQEKITLGPNYLITERDVIAFRFNKDNILKTIKILSKDDGFDIAYNSDKTEVKGVEDVSIIKDIISNIGKFKP